MKPPPLDDFPRMHPNETWNRINDSPKSSLRTPTITNINRQPNIHFPSHVPRSAEGFTFHQYLGASRRESRSNVSGKPSKPQPTKSHPVQAPTKTTKSTLAVQKSKQPSSSTSVTTLKKDKSPQSTTTTRPALSTVTNSIGQSNTSITSPARSVHYADKENQKPREHLVSPTTRTSPQVLRAVGKCQSKRRSVAISPSRSGYADDESDDWPTAEYAKNPSVVNVDLSAHPPEPPSTPSPRSGDPNVAFITPASNTTSRPETPSKIPHWTEGKLTGPDLDRFVVLILAADKKEQAALAKKAAVCKVACSPVGPGAKTPPSKRTRVRHGPRPMVKNHAALPRAASVSKPADPHIQGGEGEKRGRSPTAAEKEPLLSDRIPSIDSPSYTQWVTDTIEAAGLEIGFFDGLPESLEVDMEIEPVIPVVQEPTPPSLLADLSPSSSYATAADLDESDQTELLVPPGQPTISVSPPTPPLSGENQDDVPPLYHTSPLSTTSTPPRPDLSTMRNDPSVRLPSTRPRPPKSFVAVAGSVRSSPSNSPRTSLFHAHTHVPAGDGGSKRRAVTPVDMAMSRFLQHPRSVQKTMHGSDMTITISPPTPPLAEQASNARCVSPPRWILPSRIELSMMMMNNPWNCLPMPSPPPSPLLDVPRSTRPLPLTPISVRLFHPYVNAPAGNGVGPCGDDPFDMAIPPSPQQPRLSHGFLSPMDAIRNPRGDWSPRANSERCTPRHAESLRLTVSQIGIEPVTPPVIRQSRIVAQAWGTQNPSASHPRVRYEGGSSEQRQPCRASNQHTPVADASKASPYRSPAPLSCWKPVTTPVPPVALNNQVSRGLPAGCVVRPPFHGDADNNQRSPSEKWTDARRVSENIRYLKEPKDPTPKTPQPKKRDQRVLSASSSASRHFQTRLPRPSPSPRIPGAYDFDETVAQRQQATAPVTPTPRVSPRFTPQNRRPGLSIPKPGKVNDQPLEELDQPPPSPPVPIRLGRWLKKLFGFAR